MKEVEYGMIYGEGEIVCTCDQCENEYSYEFYDNYIDFADCQAEIKDEGWISRKINGEWYDFCCKECLNAFLSEVKQ